MQVPDHVSKAVREIGIGVGASFVVLFLLVRGTVGMVETAFLAAAVVVGHWVVTVAAERLVTDRGAPRPVIFGGLVLGGFLASAAATLLASPVLALSFVVLLAAAVGGLVRVAAVRREAGGDDAGSSAERT